MMIMANIEEANEIISDNSDEYDRNGQNATWRGKEDLPELKKKIKFMLT
jgi:hypothetical protein